MRSSNPKVTTPSSAGALLLPFMLSGAAALGYEILWTRLLAGALGQESVGVFGVLVGFFAGVVAGAWLLSPRLRSSVDPLRTFLLLETIAALYALLSPFLLRELATWLPAWGGSVVGAPGSWSPWAAAGFATSIAALVLLPATFCLGGSFAALGEEARRRGGAHGAPRQLGRLYAAHTFGAAGGVLLTSYLLLPVCGVLGSCATLAFGALLAVYLVQRIRRGASLSAAPVDGNARDGHVAVMGEFYLQRCVYYCFHSCVACSSESWRITVTGLRQVVGGPVLCYRVARDWFRDRSVAALGSAPRRYGAHLRQSARRVSGWNRARRYLDATSSHVESSALGAVDCGVALGARVIGAGGRDVVALCAAARGGLCSRDSSLVRQLLGEAILGASVFLLPTFLMGALFTQLLGRLSPDGVGRAYAINGLGAACAPFLFGVGAVTLLGQSNTLLLTGFCYLALFGALCFMTSTWSRRSVVAAGGTLALLAISAAFRLTSGWCRESQRLWQPPRVLARHEGLSGVVRVIERYPAPDQPLRYLQVDRHFSMGGGLGFTAHRMGRFPLLLHPDPESVLYLGVGTGATMAPALELECERIVGVELVPEVLECLSWFDSLNGHLASGPYQRRATRVRRVSTSNSLWRTLVATWQPARSASMSSLRTSFIPHAKGPQRCLASNTLEISATT